MAALSLFQLRNLLTTIGQLAVMKPSKDTHPTIAQIFQFMKPSFQVLNSFIEEAFGGAGLPHLKTLTLNHYLVLSMVFAIFSLTAFFRETTNHRYRLAAESEQRPLSRKDKDE